MSEKTKQNDQITSLIQENHLSQKKVSEFEEIISELRTLLQGKNEVINDLKALVLEMRETQTLYIPSKDDSIDLSLAKFINAQSDPKKLKSLFLRETKGVYQFGSKKVFVKLEADKILRIYIFYDLRH